MKTRAALGPATSIGGLIITFRTHDVHVPFVHEATYEFPCFDLMNERNENAWTNHRLFRCFEKQPDQSSGLGFNLEDWIAS